MKWVHQGLTFIIDDNEKNPWEAKEKDQAVENEEARETGLVFLGWPIEPENLREGDKRNGTVASMKENGKNKGHKEKMLLLMGMKVLQKKVDPCHSKKHKHGIGTSILREANMVSHEGEGEGAGKGDIRREQS